MSDYISVSDLQILNHQGAASAQPGAMRALLVFPTSEHGILRFHHSYFVAKAWSIHKAIHAYRTLGQSQSRAFACRSDSIPCGSFFAPQGQKMTHN